MKKREWKTIGVTGGIDSPEQSHHGLEDAMAFCKRRAWDHLAAMGIPSGDEMCEWETRHGHLMLVVGRDPLMKVWPAYPRNKETT